MTLLDRIGAAIDGLCPCGASPAPGSAYCGDDCRPTHIGPDTDTRQTGNLATAMRWRPDLVTEADDTNLTRIDQPGDRHGYTGRYNASIHQRTDRDAWHLRLDNGYRYVGLDITTEDLVSDGIIPLEMVERIYAAWARLERELDNTRHLESDTQPTNNHPDLGRWQRLYYTLRRRCQQCGQRDVPRDGRRPVLTAAITWTRLDDLDDAIRVEECQLCRNCRAPFPGPPLHLTVLGNQQDTVIRVLLEAAVHRVYGVETHLRADSPANLDSLANSLPDNIELLETRLLADLNRQRPHHPALPGHADRQRLCGWLTANNLDPGSIPENTPIDVTHDSITVQYVLRRQDSGHIILSGNRPMVRPYTVPLRIPLNEWSP